MKPSDTCWLAHEHCVKAVKASYRSIVLALENIYETSHKPETFGLSKALSSHSTIAAMYLLDYILPQMLKLSRALQTKHLDLALISSLVDATLNSLDDTILPSANWVLQLQDAREELKAATGIEVTHLDIQDAREELKAATGIEVTHLDVQDAREELKAATGIEVTHLDIALFKKEWASLLSDSSKIIYPARLDPPQKMCYEPSVFLIQRKCPASPLMSYLYMEVVQFKLSLDSLGEISQLNHWKELNLRRQPLSLLTSAQSGKRIICSLSSPKMIYPCN